VTTKTKAPTVRFIEIAYRALAEAVSLVKPHVGSDDTLPMLTGVKFDTRDGLLTLSATDRYSLAVAHLTQSDKELPRFGDFSALIPLRELVRVLSIFKPQRGVSTYTNPLRITLNDERVEFTQLAASSELAGSTLSVRLIAANFPPIDSIFKPLLRDLAAATERVPYSCFSEDKLNRYSALRNRSGGTPMVIRQLSPNKPMLVTAAINDHLELISAVMPVKLPEPTDLVKWIERYPTPEPVKEPEPVPPTPIRKRATKPTATGRKPRAKKAVSA